MNACTFKSHCRIDHNSIRFEYKCRCLIQFDTKEELIWHQQTCNKAFKHAIPYSDKNSAGCTPDGIETNKRPLSRRSHNCCEERGSASTANEVTSANKHIKDLENSQILFVANKLSSPGITPTPTERSLNGQKAGVHKNNTQLKRPTTDFSIKAILDLDHDPL